MKKTILLFDFISHENMHLPFNEGYIKSLQEGFPDDDIIFSACAGHIENLKSMLGNNSQNIYFNVIPNFSTLVKDKSYHNPLYAIPAAKQCWKALENIAHNKNIRLACILGANGALIHTFSKYWHKKQPGILHFIQHDQLSTAMNWRSKNPFIKYFDYLSVLSRGLPAKQKLVVLELGLKEVLSQYAPKLANSIITVEHPVLKREWLPAKPITPDKPIKIAFVGHCGKGKGFDKYTQLAKKFTGEKYQFYAVGKENTQQANDFDLSGLTIAPSKLHLARDEFTALLAEMDLVCLPLPTPISHVSSGSIIDGFSASKPLILTSNQSNLAIEKKYGEYGIIVSSQDELDAVFNDFTIVKFEEKYTQWQHSLEKIRLARAEKAIGQLYIKLLQQ